MIFQDPFACLHPMYRVGDQIAEAVRAHENVSKTQAHRPRRRAARRGRDPERRRAARGTIPHQFSGGMRQRAMIAMALVHNPDVLIADEPTTALDVTVQAQIIELIDRVKREFDVGVILITHDLGVVAETATHVMVMYAGRAMEYGPARRSSAGAQHPYTWGLLESMPTIEKRLEMLVPIEGSPPSLLHPPPGCPFHPRCKYRFEPCDNKRPPLVAIPGGHLDACLLPPSASARLGEPDRPRDRASVMSARAASAREHRAGHGPLVEVEHLTKHFAVKQGCSLAGRASSTRSRTYVTVAAGRRSDRRRVGLRQVDDGRLMCACSTRRRDDPLRRQGHHGRLAASLRPLRQQMQMIFQDPYSSLNPRKSVGQIIAEPFSIQPPRKGEASASRSCSPASV